jgi:orotate phosphoribosyltransferase
MHPSVRVRSELGVFLREKCLKIAPSGEEFQLASGGTSRVYLDVRSAAMAHVPLKLIGQLLGYTMLQNGMTPAWSVAGVELGGCPLATAVTLAWDLPTLYIRKKPKEHGTAKLIEGVVTPGMTVVVVEDVTTTGQSSLFAVRTLQEAGCKVMGVYTVVDREQGGAAVLAQAGVQLRSIFTLRELLGERGEGT